MSVFENPYACAYCPESFPVAEDLVKHFEIMHAHVEYPQKEKDNKDKTKSSDEMPKKTTEYVENKELDKPPNNEVNLNQVRKPLVENLIKETDTDVENENKQDFHKMDANQRSHQENTSTYLCSKCNNSYSTQQTLKEHQKVHKDKKYSCVFCPKKFYLKHHLQYHEKVHGG